MDMADSSPADVKKGFGQREKSWENWQHVDTKDYFYFYKYLNSPQKAEALAKTLRHSRSQQTKWNFLLSGMQAHQLNVTQDISS